MVDQIKHTAKNLTSFALILVFTAVGIIGVVLPILPGLPFLLLAALMASRHFPGVDVFLERNHYTAKCKRTFDKFLHLDIWTKVRVCCWWFLKVTLDVVAGVVSLIRKVGRKQSKDLVNLRSD